MSAHVHAEKVLTVSVAAYNVEDTLARCLDSCLDSRVMRDLEVIVVIDGATDSTAEIAKSYANKWQDTFRVVEKANGGYGSTVNTSMQMATGRYFRLLDGDDWFDHNGLYRLIEFCRNQDVDAVYCDKVLEYPNESLIDKLSTPLVDGQIIENPEEFDVFKPSMWNFTFSTSILKNHPFLLPNHCLYTDSLFVAYQLPYVNSIAYLSSPLYHYVLCQSEVQSTSLKSVIAHVEDNYQVWEQMLSFYVSLYGDGWSNPLMMERMRIAYNNAYQRTLMLPEWKQARITILNLEKALKESSRAVYECTSRTKTVRLMRWTNNSVLWLAQLYRRYRPYGV